MEPSILYNINNKYLMVSKYRFIYKEDYINGNYSKTRAIFDIYGDLDPMDLVELENFFNLSRHSS